MKLHIGSAVKGGVALVLEYPAMLVPLLLMALLNIVVGVYGMQSMVAALGNVWGNYGMSVERMFGVWQSIAPSLLLSLLLGLFLFLMACHMALNAKRGASLSASAQAAARMYVPLLVAGFLYAVMVAVGSFILILPGAYLFIRFMYFPWFGMAEGKGVFASLRASWALSNGSFWRNAGLVLLLTLLGMGMGLVVKELAPLDATALAQASVANLVLGALGWLFVSAVKLGVLTHAFGQLKGKS